PGFFVVGLARSSSSTRVPSTTLFRSGALTGVPLYGPAVWALFSKRQTAFSVLFVTVASLTVNIFFKFISPALLGLSLDRMQETVLGVSLPVVLLAIFEVAFRKTPYRAPAVLA